MPLAGRSSGAGRRISARASRLTSVRSAVKSSPAGGSESLDELPPACRAPRPHAPPGHPDRRPSPACGLCPPPATVPLRRAASTSSTGRSAARSPGRRRIVPGRARSTSAGRSTRSRRRRRPSAAASTPTGRSCCSSQPSLFDPTRGSAGPADGLGLLPRPQRLDGGHDGPDRGPGRAIRPRVSRPHPARHVMAPAISRPITPTTSAATSTAAPRTSASYSPARWPEPRPLLDPPARPLYLLVLDAAGRRRPWPVRISRRQGRAPGPVQGARRGGDLTPHLPETAPIPETIRTVACYGNIQVVFSVV